MDLRYPDFTARHVFTAKLRLVIITSFWMLSIFVFPGILTLSEPIMLWISATFVVTTVCYAFILKGIWPIFFFIVELAADICAHTILIYMTGGVKSNFISIYIIYCAAGGLFYNYRVSLVIALLALSFYSFLLAGASWGWLHPYSYPFSEEGVLQGVGGFQNFSLLVVFLAVAIYGIWIASHFTKLREMALEVKNRELIALNRVSSLTRSVITLERVIEELLCGVREGLEYITAFLIFADEKSGRLRIFFDGEGEFKKAFEEAVPFDLSEMSLPMVDRENLIYEAIKKKKLLIRYELFEVFRGMLPPVSREVAQSLQSRFGFKKFMAAPLVSEEKVLGALIGVSRDSWIEPDAVRAFEGFTDQAALTIDNAKLIAELKEKNIELERVSRVKSEFLATMSHELRTPLTAIIGFSELLIEDVMGAMNSDQKESLREILVNGENLLQLINGILDLAKIESGRMELSIVPVDVREIVARVQRMIASLLQKKEHRLSVVFEGDIPAVYVDERKLQQILMNLLSNAIKFTSPKGDIRVHVRFLAAATGRNAGEGSLEVTVSDSGMGIRKEDQSTIFESFRQVDSSYTREHQGTGLGLALVRQFVEVHGGKIWLESELGKGSKFIFVIPSQPHKS